MTRTASQPPLFDPDVPVPVRGAGRDWSQTIKHKKNVQAAPAPRPWLCGILAVDTAENSGWSMWKDGVLLDSGEVDTRKSEQLDAIVVDFIVNIGEGARVLVLERPWGGSTPTVIGLAMARERWERAWRDAGEAAMRIATVHPSTWRAKTLGNIRGLKRDEIRAMERRAAAQISPKYSGDLGDDECAALCIGRWSTMAVDVGKRIGARAVQASMAAWRTR